MRIADMNWMQVEAYLRKDDRCVLPLGSTEQHAFLSLAVDLILAERVAVEAAAPLGIPVYPVMPFGLAPYFTSFPGTISLRLETLIAVFRDVIASLHTAGFRRVLIVNGHGGNAPVGALTLELMAAHPGMAIRFHNWWNAPRTWAQVQATDPSGSHANWMENFPWTRLGNIAMPAEAKPMMDQARFIQLDPAAKKALLGDGNYGGLYQRSDQDTAALWEVAVAETRSLIADDWA